MTILKPGHVPEGWTRGARIFISKSSLDPRLYGRVVYGGTNTEPFNPMAIGSIDFGPGDALDVNAWITWWFGKTDLNAVS